MVVSKMVHRGQINWVILRNGNCIIPQNLFSNIPNKRNGGGGVGAFTIIFSLLDNYSSITSNQVQLTGLSLKPVASNLEKTTFPH